MRRIDERMRRRINPLGFIIDEIAKNKIESVRGEIPEKELTNFYNEIRGSMLDDVRVFFEKVCSDFNIQKLDINNQTDINVLDRMDYYIPIMRERLAFLDSDNDRQEWERIWELIFDQKLRAHGIRK